MKYLIFISVSFFSLICQAQLGLGIYEHLKSIYEEKNLPLLTCRNKSNSTEAVRCYLETGYGVNQPIGSLEETFLHIAVKYNDWDSVQFLLKKGADPNAENIHSWTPFHHAISTGNEALAIFLFMQGADPTITNSDDITPFYSAVTSLQRNLANLIWRIEGPTKIDLNARDYEGKTILHHLAEMAAAYYGNVEHILQFTKWFFSIPGANIDVHAKDFDGNTALHVFVDESDGVGSRFSLNFLFQSGVFTLSSCSAENDDNETPVDIAERYWDKETDIDWLREKCDC